MTPIELFHEKAGTGRPIVCLHGFGATSYLWRSIVPALASRNEVHIVDLKGFGRSPKPWDGRYSIVDQAELVLSLISKEKLKNVTLVGHSLGGSVAIVLAQRLAQTGSDALSSLVLMSTPAGDERGPWFGKLVKHRILGPVVLRILPPRLQVYLALRFTYHDNRKITRAQVEEYARSLGSPGGREALHQTLRAIDDAIIALLKSYIAAIRVPTLLVWGRHDPLVPVESGHQLENMIKGSKLEVIENSGHTPAEETPDPVIRAIVEFLHRGATEETIGNEVFARR